MRIGLAISLVFVYGNTFASAKQTIYPSFLAACSNLDKNSIVPTKC
jgi:hypothetical protein